MHQPSPAAEKIKTENKRKPPKKISAQYLHNSGLHYLERFAASAAHFRKVMTRKIDRSCAFHTDQDRSACLAMLEDLIEKFRRAGLLDDTAYMRGMVQSLRRRGLSARMIAAKLSAKGLEARAVKAALDAHDVDSGAEDSEFAAALRLARRKRLGSFARQKPDERDYNRHLAALARAGFSCETAQRVLNLPAEEAEEWIAL